MKTRYVIGVEIRLTNGSKRWKRLVRWFMAMIPLPPDFSEFLRLLNDHEVKYLLIGGYAVAYHGYVRATAAMDVWVQRDREDADRDNDLYLRRRV